MHKRIVFFIGTLMEGGAERVISILSSYFAAHEYEVEILMYYDREVFYQIDPRVKIVSVEREVQGNLIRKIQWLRKHLSAKADIVISFLCTLNMVAITSLLGTGKPIIVADRNDPSKTPEKAVLRGVRNFLYRFSSKVVVQTTHNYEYFPFAVKKNAVVIPNPVNMGDSVGLALRTEKKKRIVSIGRLIPQKNQKLLIAAFNEVVKAFPEYTLTIYGEGESRGELENYIKRLGIGAIVDLPGSKKNVHGLMADASLFVLPSLYEGMPNVLIEAMCLGLPCISTMVSGADDLIQNNESGLIVKNNDQDDMVRAMTELLSNEALRNSFGEQAVKVAEKLTPETIASEWERVIKSLLI